MIIKYRFYLDSYFLMSLKVKNIFIKYNLYDDNIVKYKKIDLCRVIYEKTKRYTMSTLCWFSIDMLEAMIDSVGWKTLNNTNRYN